MKTAYTLAISGIILMVLKIAGVTGISWWVVFAPWYVPIVAEAIFVLWTVHRNNNRYNKQQNESNYQD